MPTCAVLSFRFGETDGVSIVAARWGEALRQLGFDVVTVAGAGSVDRTVAGLGISDGDQVEPHRLRAAVTDALADCDLVVVENLATIPLNRPAAFAVCDVLEGRPAIMHHHDPPWERPQFASVTDLPRHDPAWRHVAITAAAAHELTVRGFPATVIYNAFHRPGPGDRAGTRAAVRVVDGERLLVHPVRAIARKNIPQALRLADQLDATYWLLGPAEDGYDAELASLLAAHPGRVIHRSWPDLNDVYAAGDGVVFPSTWEGFGNPPIEAALRRRPVAIGSYPFAAELARLGFRFAPADDPAVFGAQVDCPDRDLLDHNERLAAEHFSFDRLVVALRDLLASAGWMP